MSKGKNQDLGDEQVLKLLAEGNRLAFHRIYEQHWKHLYNFTFNILRDSALTEDCLQEVFTNIWIKRKELKIESIKSYLFSACRNKAISKIRQSRFTELHEVIINSLVLDADVETKWDLEALKSDIDQASRDLPDRCRQIFYMSRFDELSIKEIALNLNISTRTVENQLSAALRHIRSSLTKAMIIVLIFSSL